MKCNRCGREITEDQAYAYQGKAICDECLMDIGLSTKECDPWSSYVDTHTRSRAGFKGADGLSALEKRIYELVKSQGRMTRQKVMTQLNLSAADLQAQLIPLMHAELIKERGEGDSFYLIPVD